jgi:hypothetical protein
MNRPRFLAPSACKHYPRGGLARRYVRGNFYRLAILAGFFVGNTMTKALDSMSELELLERGLTGWNRHDEDTETNLATFDRGEMVAKFLEYRRLNPRKK